MKLFPLYLLLITVVACSQETPPGLAASLQIADQLHRDYAQYRDSAISIRRFTLADIEPSLDRLPPTFKVEEVGRSVENRPINRVVWGEGPVQVLLWSQMHGDEPTATAAILDIFNFLSKEEENYTDLRELLRTQLTLTFLPMLNPDGAQRFIRRNALGVDLNRDALRLQSPESRILKQERDRLNADWGFNLHDQSIYYGVGFPAEESAAISILAPAFDWEKTVNPQREDAMQLIGVMNNYWQSIAPGRVGRYKDDFEPRAFGDNIQKWGTKTILIESGGWPGDREKQNIRQLNFTSLLMAFHSIATNSYEGLSRKEYEGIPENSYNAWYDLIIRRATVRYADGDYQLDIGIRRPEYAPIINDRDFYLDGIIRDLGDLHTFKGFKEIDGSGLVAKIGKVHPEVFDFSDLDKIDIQRFYKQGYTSLQIRDLLTSFALDFTGVRLVAEGQIGPNNIRPGIWADLLLYRDEKLEHAVIMGEIIPIVQE